jgi:hypothetical protein
MRTVLTALATTLMFFSGTLCDGLACNLETEALIQPAEESETEAHLRYPSLVRDGVKAGSRKAARRTGDRTFEELRTKRRLAAGNLRKMDWYAAESKKPADKDAVIIDHDLRLGRIDAERTGSAPGGVKNLLEYRFSVDVDNRGDSGKVLIILTGKGRDGREIGSVMLKDVLHGKESKTLVATTSLTSLKSREIETWEVFRAHKFRCV